MPEERWDVLSSETVLQHPFLTIEMQTVRLPDGRVIEGWPIANARDYVMVVAQNEAGQLLILEGYKHGLGRSSWQVVGGYLERGEEPLAAAKRELLEEAGYASEDWQPLSTFVVDANRRMSTAHLFLALSVRPSIKMENDDIEQVALRWVSVAEVRRALYDGRVGIISSAVAIALALPFSSSVGT